MKLAEILDVDENQADTIQELKWNINNVTNLIQAKPTEKNKKRREKTERRWKIEQPNLLNKANPLKTTSSHIIHFSNFWRSHLSPWCRRPLRVGAAAGKVAAAAPSAPASAAPECGGATLLPRRRAWMAGKRECWATRCTASRRPSRRRSSPWKV